MPATGLGVGSEPMASDVHGTVSRAAVDQTAVMRGRGVVGV